MARELVITKVPNRSGLFLGVTERGVFKSIARFTHGEQSAEAFVEIMKSVGFKFIDDREREEPDGAADGG